MEKNDSKAKFSEQFKPYRSNGANLLLPQDWAERERARLKKEKTEAVRALMAEPRTDISGSKLGDKNPTKDNFNFGEEEKDSATEEQAALDEERAALEAKWLAEQQRELKNKRMIQIFNMKTIVDAEAKIKNGSRDDKKRILYDLDHAGKNDGMRLVPSFKGLRCKMSKMAVRFPNFKAAIDGMSEDFVLSSIMPANKFSIAPVLLDGVPGIGKTAFAQAMAETLGLPFLKISAAGMQHPAQLTGTAMHWSNASAGQIFDLLAKNDSAVAVLLIDEVDKMPNNSDYPVIPAFLELLEPESSRKFQDVSLMVEMDASRLIVMMTSNNKQKIDSALLSRAAVHDIEKPTEDQYRHIATGFHNALCKGSRRKIELDVDALSKLMDGDLDLREITRAVRSGFIRAVMDKRKVSVPACIRKTEKKRIGF